MTAMGTDMVPGRKVSVRVMPFMASRKTSMKTQKRS